MAVSRSRPSTSFSRVSQAAKDYGPALLVPVWTPSRRFVIITTGRTGSELLVSLLDSHPQIRCGGEILRDGRAFPHRFVAARAAAAGVRGAKAFGWKLLLGHFRNPGGTIRGIGNPDQYPARLAEMGYMPILLERRNPVKQAISFIIGADRQFHYRNGSRDGFDPITIDPVRLMAATGSSRPIRRSSRAYSIPYPTCGSPTRTTCSIRRPTRPRSTACASTSASKGHR